ncbi:hypothetical protein V1517DRAFT_87362 [Lipomyces orientalis]|uniref:Uncharacterized protein n=1 Tax=Lipomyces orientalis TaxID=1233043 RepID=A0ACC3TRM1_9ASCO
MSYFSTSLRRPLPQFHSRRSVESLVKSRSQVDLLKRVIDVESVSSLCTISSSIGRIAPAYGRTWEAAAVRFSNSERLSEIMVEWVETIFEHMLFPIRRDGAIPESLNGSGMSSSAGASSLRSRLLDRDGIVSPVGRAIDRSAPKCLRQSGLGRVDILEVAYIMHLLVSKYSRMQNLLSMFAGTNVKPKLNGQAINSPRNMFCTDHFTRTLFDEFFIGVEHLNGKFWLRKLRPRAALGNIGVCQNGEEVIFGHGPLGLTIDLPDGELFNIHLAIGRVLHMSGLGEIISNIPRDEMAT